MNGLMKVSTLLALASLTTGCKLAVMVESGGNVTSASGTRDCAGPRYCEFDITDAAFSETFTAIPRPGFEFVKWQNGDGFFCANSTDPVCTVEMLNEDAGAAIVALFKTGSIRPLFSTPQGVDTDGDGMINELDFDDDEDGVVDESDSCPLDGPNLDGMGCPSIAESETVLIYEKRWAQPYLFEGVTWHDVNAACPGPSGVCSGKLGDVEVTGWTWASGADVTDLLNAFLGTELGAVPDLIETSGWTDFSPNIFDYFYGSDSEGAVSLYGWIREEANVVEAYPYGVRCAALDDRCYNLRAGAYDIGPLPKTLDFTRAWLYRVD